MPNTYCTNINMVSVPNIHHIIHPIIHLLNECAEANNSNPKKYTISILCDLSKAFDVISHNILLKKLGSQIIYQIDVNMLKFMGKSLTLKIYPVEYHRARYYDHCYIYFTLMTFQIPHVDIFCLLLMILPCLLEIKMSLIYI